MKLHPFDSSEKFSITTPSTINRRKVFVVLTFVAVCSCLRTTMAAGDVSLTRSEPLILAHYMPWYELDKGSNFYGWHWTMNHFDPNQKKDGKSQIAARYYPEIGPYSSNDPQVIEYHLMLMKLAGIDGVIIDWYGLSDFRDYPKIHNNSRLLVQAIEQAGMKFAICYEDRTINYLVENGKLAQSERVQHASNELDWLADKWFQSPSYVRLNGKPILLSFGQNHLKTEEWQAVLSNRNISYFSQHLKRAYADGAFDWPVPKDFMSARSRYTKRSKSWRHSFPCAVPRFDDIYEIAGVRASWGSIPDEDGSTFKDTFSEAVLTRNAPFIQLVTWNDWGEGTQIEPSRQFGTRDLEVVQRFKKRQDKNFAPTPEHLKIPLGIYQARKNNSIASSRLNRIVESVFQVKNLDRAIRELPAAVVKKPKDKIRGIVSTYETTKDINYRKELGDELDEYMAERCFLDVYFPKNKNEFSTVVWFHAGGLTQGSRSIPAELKGQGFAVVAVDYRLSPRAKAPAYIEDAAAAVAWTFKNIKKYGGSANRIYVAGHSAGGYLTAMVGLDKRWLQKYGIDANRIAGLVPYSGHSITHMTVRKEKGISDKTPIIDELAPLFHVRKDIPPMLLITGDRELELLGRYEETAYFWRMLKIVGCQEVDLVELKGFDHGKMCIPAHEHLIEFIGNNERRSKGNK